MNLPFVEQRLNQSTQYVGRFAPSPSGPLHLGSLVAALGSYLRARQLGGKWLLRIEDIDPPREQSGATERIQTTLACHGLIWDDEVVYQHDNHSHYEQALTALFVNGHSYYCQCTRKERLANPQGQRCPCAELTLAPSTSAIVLRNSLGITEMNDLLLGQISFGEEAKEDFILRRKDGLYAYQLAVVVDDIHAGVTEVVRGADILPATAYQLALYRLFEQSPPVYLHLPLVLGENNQKLSKQNHAPALINTNARRNLCTALGFLGLKASANMNDAPVDEILAWATHNWNVTLIADKANAFGNRIDASDSI